jgi:hypothetical protein
MRGGKENKVETSCWGYREGSETKNLDEDMHNKWAGWQGSSPGGGESEERGGKKRGPIDQGF